MTGEGGLPNVHITTKYVVHKGGGAKNVQKNSPDDLWMPQTNPFPVPSASLSAFSCTLKGKGENHNEDIKEWRFFADF